MLPVDPITTPLGSLRLFRRTGVSGMALAVILAGGLSLLLRPQSHIAITGSHSAKRNRQYRIVEIMAPEKWTSVYATRMSSDGRYVCGVLLNGSKGIPFVWKDGKFDRLGDEDIRVNSVNCQGVAVGFRQNEEYSYAMIWKPGKPPEQILDEPARAHTIDNAGTIYGWKRYWGKGTYNRLFVQTSAGDTRFFTPADGSSPGFVAVNQTEKAIVAAGEFFFLYRNHDLITLLPSKAADRFAVYGLNDREESVGYEGISGHQAPMLWHKASPERIDNLPTSWNATAIAINNRNDIVGLYSVGGNPENLLEGKGFLYQNGVFSDLSDHTYRKDLGLMRPIAINDGGIVLARCHVGNRIRSVLLIPTSVRAL